MITLDMRAHIKKIPCSLSVPVAFCPVTTSGSFTIYRHGVGLFWRRQYTICNRHKAQRAPFTVTSQTLIRPGTAVIRGLLEVPTQALASCEGQA